MKPVNLPLGWAWYALMVGISVLIFSGGGTQASAQGRIDSPVFRGYRPAAPRQLPRNPDPEEQWRVMQLLREAGAGDRFAQHELGLRYLFGDGFQSDTAKAAYWIGKAAAQQLVLAKYNFALLQANGWGTEWNPFAAFEGFLFAAERGQPESQHVLGLVYTEDLVVQRNWAEALRWVKLASDSGYAPAKAVLADLEKAMQKDLERVSPEKETESSDPLPPASGAPSWSPVFLDFQQDSAAPPADLNTLAREAVATSNLSRADSSIILAAAASFNSGPELRRILGPATDAGNPEVISFLAMCASEGIGFERDPLFAASMYIRGVYLESHRCAALLWKLTRVKGFFQVLQARVADDDPLAMFVQAELIALDFDGRITERQAFELLQRAATLGHQQAQIHLAIRFLSGRWVKRDRIRGLEMLNRVAAQGNTEAGVRHAASVLNSDTASREEMTRSIAVLRDADVHGSVLARVSIASAMERGTGLALDKGGAARLYRSCAMRGSRSALRALRRMHDEIRPQAPQYKVNYAGD